MTASKSNLSKLDQGWNAIEEKYRFLDGIERDGFFRITADEIKTVREPRLMTKLDHASDLPQIFKRHKLAILPETRGTYIIAPMLLYQPFEEELTMPKISDIRHIAWDKDLQSLDINSVPSETIAINTAEIGGVLTSFLGEEPLYATVAGRMKSDEFEFHVRTPSGSQLPIRVQNSQIEIDAGFESPESLILLEAKNYVYDDFLVRQLYYPMRTWEQKIDKPVRTVFFMYSNGIYHLIEYGFDDLYDYNSLRVLRHGHYSLDDTNITVADLMDVAAQSKPRKEPKDIPFPQADKMWRIINLAEMLAEEPMTKTDIAENYSFAYRQADYYTSAAKYLGLVEDCADGVQATRLMQRLMKKPYKPRQLEYAKLILWSKIFFEAFHACNISNTGVAHIPSREAVMEIMRNNIELGTDAVYRRRAMTVRGWLDWMFRLCKDVGCIERA